MASSVSTASGSSLCWWTLRVEIIIPMQRAKDTLAHAWFIVGVPRQGQWSTYTTKTLRERNCPLAVMGRFWCFDHRPATLTLVVPWHVTNAGDLAKFRGNSPFPKNSKLQFQDPSNRWMERGLQVYSAFLHTEH